MRKHVLACIAALTAAAGLFADTAAADGGLSVTITVGTHLLEQGDRTDVSDCATNDTGVTQHRIQILLRQYHDNGQRVPGQGEQTFFDVPNGQQVCLNGALTSNCQSPPDRYVIQGAAYDSSGDIVGSVTWGRLLRNPSCGSAG